MASHPPDMGRAMDSLWQLVVPTQVPATLSGPQARPGLLLCSKSARLPLQSLNSLPDSPPYCPSNAREFLGLCPGCALLPGHPSSCCT